ncbi:uncharacterized protein DCS_00284 [Drechmeria coniospora]|uniref:Protein CAP22 n=1 Tax=Drechmeria coniospora TaxID=98403 RepID=A0A151GPW1_DRECN|nr:uncharacterized protein DCS_00284 [Drechmeria coniospora]KYK59154.1 uncharacterized protein DCS_00284 [Drechmeria coniospora]ODA77904.1 hypothetical protein RJ55_06507 [Drechmeria coniospora]
MFPLRVLCAIAPLLLAVRADVDLDLDDVPNACQSICRPVSQLARVCETDAKGTSDRDNDLLEAQCVCTNKSFDVAKVAALCAACMHQNNASRDDLGDIDGLLATCSFSSTTYAPTATGLVSSISVSATPVTDSNQLTTTMAGGTSAGAVQTSKSTTSSRNAAPTRGAGVLYVAGAVVAGGLML